MIELKYELSKNIDDLNYRIKESKNTIETLETELNVAITALAALAEISPSIKNVKPFSIFSATIGYIIIIPVGYSYSGDYSLGELNGDYTFKRMYRDSPKNTVEMIHHLKHLNATFTNKQYNIGDVK